MSFQGLKDTVHEYPRFHHSISGYASNRLLPVREATVIRTGSGFCTIKFNDNETPAGTRVRESKLFQTKQEAEIVVEKTHNTLLY